jgi:2-iminobutanoate/2-iminopropanoate deaminase
LIVPAGGRGGWLSPGILVGNTLYMSGQLPAGNLRDSSIGVQTRSVIERTKPILEAAGMTLADVVSIQAYLVDMADYNGFNAVYREFFTAEPAPTRTTVIVKELVQGAKLELTMTAVKAQ